MRAAILLLPALLLGGCALHPLYAGGGSGPVATTLAGVGVAPIEGKAGWLMGNALRDRLQGGEGQRYRLDVKLDDRIAGLGVRRDDSVARERRTLRARYQLIDAINGTVMLDATAGSDAGIDVIGSSEYSTITAENIALERLAGIVADQIVARIAVYARRGPGAFPQAAPVPSVTAPGVPPSETAPPGSPLATTTP